MPSCEVTGLPPDFIIGPLTDASGNWIARYVSATVYPKYYVVRTGRQDTAKLARDNIVPLRRA